MTVRKLSVALDEEVAAAAAVAAELRGVSLSAWLNEAAANALAIDEGLAAVDIWESEHGHLTVDELKAADTVLNRASAPGRRRRAG